MNPSSQIYWHTTVRMPDGTDPRPLPEKVDVAVVGGGFTGLSAARALARRGASVAVLEANDYFNPHLLVKNDFKRRLRSRFFRQLLASARVYEVNTRGTPEESQRAIAELLGET